MKVLICAPNLLSTVGGGQRVYRRLIESNPDIEFHVFENKKPECAIPHNVVLRIFNCQQQHFTPRTPTFGKWLPRWIWDAGAQASEFAQQVCGETFDVVDIPDYYSSGLFLKPAFSYYGVTAGRFALGLHGSCSTTHVMDWDPIARDSTEENIAENLQYRALDIRYSLSRRYKKEWEEIALERTEYLDPLNFIEIPQPITIWPEGKKCDLVFIGRPEKRKGPDIFLDIVKQIPKELIGSVKLIGPKAFYTHEISAHEHLQAEALKRGIDSKVYASMNERELREVLSSRTIVFTPSRYDTFNLVAFEGLFAACPSVIGTGAGVVDFLTERAPAIPYLALDPNALHKVLPGIVNLIQNYDSERSALLDKVKATKLEKQGQTLKDIYSKKREFCSEVVDTGYEWYAQFSKSYDAVVHPGKSRLRMIGNRISRQLQEELNLQNGSQDRMYESMAVFPEVDHQHIKTKINILSDIASTVTFDRVSVWLEIARLERMRGNLIAWATYQTRAMRLLGASYNGRKSELVKVLGDLNFTREADAVRCWHSRELSLQYLEANYRNNQNEGRHIFEYIEDRRHTQVPKVSIIVSMYNAGSKLELFLRKIAEQTLFAQKQIEIILIDSCSPTNEFEVFDRVQKEIKLPIVYGRSQQRETIQTAWNQGIEIAKAEYLCFLGVDETLRPDALSLLAKYLDEQKDIDWVTGDSVVTEVDSKGNFVKRIMAYERNGYNQDIVRLETCYLSWVGALYRKNIHDRFGYYDGTFRAAGDTEFKSRVLSKIKTAHIPEMLGIFLNYPEERTTASPTAELEDMRAWYLHRTVAGVEYAFGNRPAHELEEQVIRALTYRKSYTQHPSTDFDYANNVLEFLSEKDQKSKLIQLHTGVKQILKMQQKLEVVEDINAVRLQYLEDEAKVLFANIQKEHSQILSDSNLVYRITNDNRYEQHHWPWRMESFIQSNRKNNRYVW